MTASCSAWGQERPRDSAGRFYAARQLGLLCRFLHHLFLSPWQSALVLLHQLRHLRFSGSGNAHCRSYLSGGGSDGLGSCDQNAIGRLWCFFFTCHVMTILTRICKKMRLFGVVDMTVRCSACGQSWTRDPALEVVCPTCNSQVGSYCGSKRPSGHKVRFGSTLIHPARDQLAVDRGLLRRCTAARKEDDADSLPLFADCQPPAPLLQQATNDGGFT
jgi:hypothetical protein